MHEPLIQKRLGTPFQWIAVVACIFVLLLTAIRIQQQYHPGGPYRSELAGMVDFHNGVYQPTRAFMQKVSPYGNAFAESFPVERPAPAYSPLVFLIHVPLAIVPLPLADALCFLLVAALFWAIAKWSVAEADSTTNNQVANSWLLVVMLFIAVSRPGHTTLVSGYFTAELALGVILAFHYARKNPLLSGVGIALASCKPTFAIPLGLTMLARRDFVALFWGVAFSMVGALIAGCWLASDMGWTGLLESIKEGQSAHMADAFEYPVNTWTRIDIVAIVAKWLESNPSELTQLLWMLPLIALPCFTLWKIAGWRLSPNRQEESCGVNRNSLHAVTDSASAMIASLAITVTLYRHVYDALLLLPCIVTLGFRRTPFSRPERIFLLTLVGAPFWNYLSSETILNRIDGGPIWYGVLTSMNAVALAIALLYVCGRWIAICQKESRISNGFPK